MKRLLARTVKVHERGKEIARLRSQNAADLAKLVARCLDEEGDSTTEVMNALEVSRARVFKLAERGRARL